MFLLEALALAQVIVGGARPPARRGVEAGLAHHHNAAVFTHLDGLEPLRRALEHPMLAFELGNDPLDRTLDPERLAATDALKRLFFFDDARGGGRGAEVDLRLQADHFLGAGRLA